MSLQNNLQRRGLMLVLSSPSGAGKTTLARRLVETNENLRISISVTTRVPRQNEVDGEDYQFVEEQAFQAMVDSGEFLEHARVFEHFYGTPSQAVYESLANGDDILFDIDWQGAQQITEHARNDVVKIFVLPPSTEELMRRLKKRAQDPEKVLSDRMAKAADEITHWPEYDYVIVNEDLEIAVTQITRILTAERLRRHRRTGLSKFVEKLTKGRP
jgi:guanylate kinase